MTEVGPSIRYVKVVPGYDCSRGCDYCYNTLLHQKTSPQPATLPSAVQQVLDAVTAPVTVELIGGEPLEPPALASTLALARLAVGHPNCEGVVLSTAVASVSVLRRVLPSIRQLYLSVDLSSSDRNRKRLSDRRLALVKEVCDAEGTTLFPSAVLFGDETLDDMLAFMSMLASLGIDVVGVSHQTARPLTDEHVSTAVRQYYDLFRLRLAMRNTVRIVGTVLDSIELALLGGQRTGPCECGDTSIVIEPDGAVTTGLCTDHDTGRPEVAAFREMQARRQAHLAAGPCRGCVLWDVCRGGCQSEGLRLGGSPLARAELQCRILLGVHELVRRDVAVSVRT